MTASRTRGSPNFARTLDERSHEIGSPTRRRWRSHPRSLTPPSRPAQRCRVSQTQGDETLTIEQHIEELRTELKNACDVTERREIQAEFEMAQAELAVITAEHDAEPPF